MNLIIDIGNTRTKIALFEKDKFITQSTVNELTIEKIEELHEEYPKISKVIVSSVRADNVDVNLFLKENFDFFINLDHNTPVPITNLYKSPETLGLDRLAAAIGAASLQPNKNLLIIDSGTAITYEFVSDKNEYLGGNISPGLNSRFRALNSFTGKLPLVNQNNNSPSIGYDTESAILAGVQQGLLFEVERYIENFYKKHANGIVFITGGDAVFLDKHLKNSIFVNQNLTLIGLNEIIRYIQ